MANDASKVLEGAFALNKPPGYSSAQVLRELQSHFAESKTFSGLLQETRRIADQNGHSAKRRKHNDRTPFKLGHGGTLDPLATGVMVCGIGRGTKYLDDFLGSTKTYETVALFGKSTESYDVDGKIVAEGPTKHITRKLVEEQLANFRGKIKQLPPIYSALKINGMKAYEYAKLGKELPRQLEARDMTVEECELLEWYDEGHHDFRWPAEEAAEDEKEAARTLGDTSATTSPPAGNQASALQNAAPQGQRKWSEGLMTGEPAKDIPEEEPRSSEPTQPHSTSPVPTLERKPSKSSLHRLKGPKHIHTIRTPSPHPATGPAARIRLTVSSGFYVRSFVHDLGIACGSYGIMAELIRTRQSKYTCVEPCPEGLTPALTLEDIEAGEEVWGPKIRPVLERWVEEHPPSLEGQRQGRRDDRSWAQRGSTPYQGRGRSGGNRNWGDRADRLRQRRNSSSQEE